MNKQTWRGQTLDEFVQVMLYEYNTQRPYASSILYWSHWFDYKGGEVLPFAVYMRLNTDVAVISNISAISNRGKVKVRAGRLKPLVDALFKVRSVVVFESVVNPDLIPWLEKEGFSRASEDNPTYRKDIRLTTEA